MEPIIARMTKDPGGMGAIGGKVTPVDARLARFGDMAGVHGALAEVTARLTIRIPRDTNLRLLNLGRLLPMRPAALHVLALDTVSRLDPAEFFAVIGELRKRSRCARAKKPEPVSSGFLLAKTKWSGRPPPQCPRRGLALGYAQ